MKRVLRVDCKTQADHSVADATDWGWTTSPYRDYALDDNGLGIANVLNGLGISNKRIDTDGTQWTHTNESTHGGNKFRVSQSPKHPSANPANQSYSPPMALTYP